MTTVSHFLGNRAWTGTSTRTAEVHNPATGAVTGKVASCSPNPAPLAFGFGTGRICTV